jgi:aminopeptidase-like protein
MYWKVICVLEENRRYLNQNPKCEPQLGRRGIYRSMGGQVNQPLNEFAMLWVLNMSDGAHTLLDIAERSGLPFQTVLDATVPLVDKGLLKSLPAPLPGAFGGTP